MLCLAFRGAERRTHVVLHVRQTKCQHCTNFDGTPMLPLHQRYRCANITVALTLPLRHRYRCANITVAPTLPLSQHYRCINFIVARTLPLRRMKIEADASADLLAHQGDYQGAAKVSAHWSTSIHRHINLRESLHVGLRIRMDNLLRL